MRINISVEFKDINFFTCARLYKSMKQMAFSTYMVKFIFPSYRDFKKMIWVM